LVEGAAVVVLARADRRPVRRSGRGRAQRLDGADLVRARRQLEGERRPAVEGRAADDHLAGRGLRARRRGDAAAVGDHRRDGALGRGAAAAGAAALDDLPGWAAFLHPGSGGEQEIAVWIVVTCAVVMALGTASGGWKIIKTMGHKMVKLHPIHGFAAETSSATILTLAAHFGMPVSTTHSISTAIMGVGFAK